MIKILFQDYLKDHSLKLFKKIQHLKKMNIFGIWIGYQQHLELLLLLAGG